MKFKAGDIVYCKTDFYKHHPMVVQHIDDKKYRNKDKKPNDFFWSEDTSIYVVCTYFLKDNGYCTYNFFENELVHSKIYEAEHTSSSTLYIINQ